jgi:hypothetical protein
MRIALLVGLVLATAACGAYRFPGPGGETGTVHGQVIALGCGGPIQPDAGVCPAQGSIACPPPTQPANQTCGKWPMTGFQLTFTDGGTKRSTTTDGAGAYSIDLPVGTWQVTTSNYSRIVQGPESIAVSAGASIEADYVVDTGIRAAA